MKINYTSCVMVLLFFFLVWLASVHGQECDDTACFEFCLGVKHTTKEARCATDQTSCICTSEDNQSIKVRFLETRRPVPPTTTISTPLLTEQDDNVQYVMSQPMPAGQSFYNNPEQSHLPETKPPKRIPCDAFELAAYLCDDFCRVQVEAQYGLCNITDETCVCVGGLKNSFTANSNPHIPIPVVIPSENYKEVEDILNQSKKPWYSLFWEDLIAPLESNKPAYEPLPQNPEQTGQYQSAYMYHYPANEAGSQQPQYTGQYNYQQNVPLSTADWVTTSQPQQPNIPPNNNDWTATSYLPPHNNVNQQQDLSQQYYWTHYNYPSSPPQLPANYDPSMFKVNMQKFSVQDALRPNEGGVPTTMPILSQMDTFTESTTATSATTTTIMEEVNVTSAMEMNENGTSVRRKRDVRNSHHEKTCSQFDCGEVCHLEGYRAPACLPTCRNGDCFCLCKTSGENGSVFDDSYNEPSTQVMYSAGVRYANEEGMRESRVHKTFQAPEPLYFHENDKNGE